MLGEHLKIGDKVSIEISQENREWGFNPCEDGTIAEVIGFSTIDYGRLNNHGRGPGIFENRSWVKLKMPDDTEKCLSSCFVKMVDKKEFKNRQKIKFPDAVKIAELPETKFWEGDFVKINQTCRPSYDDWKNPIILRIDYSYINQKDCHGNNMPIYSVSSTMGGCYTSFTEDALTLVKRGNVWNYYHNEPMIFASVKEELEFYHRMGFSEEVRNPNTGNYAWNSFEEIKEAILKGIGDIIIGNNLYKLKNPLHNKAKMLYS